MRAFRRGTSAVVLVWLASPIAAAGTLPADYRMASSAAAARRVLLENAGPATTSPTLASRADDALLAQFARLLKPQPPLDVIVNNPAFSTPDLSTQSETSFAVHGRTICAGYNSSAPGGFSGLARSTDGGITWTDEHGIGQAGDPALAAHAASGTFYYGELA